MITKFNGFLRLNENNIVSLSDIDTTISKIFNDTAVSSVNTLYEKHNDGYKLIITLNNLFYDKTNIIHTKFVFYVDENKQYLTSNQFIYLYDINCVFKTVEFKDINDLENRINKLISDRVFGDDLITISDLSITMTSNTNEWLNDNNITELSVYNISYNPLTDSIPCKSLSFNYDINIDDRRNIDMVIRKISDNEYNISFKENDWFDDQTINTLESTPQKIGEMIKNHII